ncbi:S8 family peptidase [Zhouia sp. PK063]|uniref:S8 family peptidase n=1 Tax=Zhouia sp. PK063 TaxID=3373602 RepID=UPI0037976B89
MRLVKPIVLTAAATLMLAGCGSSKVISNSVETLGPTMVEKKAELADPQLKQWNKLDEVADTVPGMSVNKAYTDILKGRKSTTVIVGVVDSGVDIDHEDLKNIIWTNKGEIPNNGIDDDHNGFIDDVHGWNFLGDVVNENLELVRMLKKGDDGSAAYKQAKKEYDQQLEEAKSNSARYEQILKILEPAHELIKKETGKEKYTKEDVENIKQDDIKTLQAKDIVSRMLSYGQPIEEVLGQLREGIKYFNDQLKYNLNMDFDGRKVLNDDPDSMDEKVYGNNIVYGPDKEEAKHGTHVAGIIAAQRNNGIGTDGVANNVKILVVRAVPNGDEYDKDVALGIRYAVDNGAKVINTSFGKYYSPHTDWVLDAIKYAAKHDVLIVNAAGNDSENIDTKQVYPNDAIGDNPEIADNFLTVGALDVNNGPKMVASYSNYGKKNVDVFAPGSQIWSTTPNNHYEFLQGTSMASPAVAGVAAVIREYFPTLTASQVKKVIMDSGLAPKVTVELTNQETGETTEKSFADLSKSGKIVNLYNALILASKLANSK